MIPFSCWPQVTPWNACNQQSRVFYSRHKVAFGKNDFLGKSELGAKDAIHMSSMTTKWPLTRVHAAGSAVGVEGGVVSARLDDVLGTEEPLELRIHAENSREPFTLAIAMRTPGHDEELLTGLLIAEGIIWERNQLVGMERTSGRLTASLVNVGIASSEGAQRGFSARRLLTSSACGTCSKTDWDQVLPERRSGGLEGEAISLSVSDVLPLLQRLSEAQPCFAATGAVHGTALFDADLELLAAAEDVGRHNAFDKAIGHYFLSHQGEEVDPLCARKLAAVSGRIGFELVQKAIMGGIELIVAYGAPTSAAAELALKHDITLIGMAREGRCNIYTHDYRIKGTQLRGRCN